MRGTMAELYDTEPAPKRAFLVSINGPETASETESETASLAKELASLAATLGLEIAAQ